MKWQADLGFGLGCMCTVLVSYSLMSFYGAQCIGKLSMCESVTTIKLQLLIEPTKRDKEIGICLILPTLALRSVYRLLGFFSVVLACYIAHSGGDLTVYGTKKSKQAVGNFMFKSYRGLLAIIFATHGPYEACYPFS